MSTLLDYLKMAIEERASDLFIMAGLPISFKVSGTISPRAAQALSPIEAEALVEELYRLAGRDRQHFLASGDDDFSLSVSGLSRFRVSAYRQRGSVAAVVRVVHFRIPDYQEIHIPSEVMAIAEQNKGLVLVTGPIAGGKSTTLACIIDQINQNRNCHIITLEDPIEFLHKNKKSVVSQREIATDTENYITALRACLRQSPDIILLGEMRDYEAIKTAMTAAETGHLVISTLHTVGAVNTIDRIIDVFPPDQQHQIRVQLSMLLQTVISQQLIPDVDGGLIPAFEIMHVNNAIRNLIRESKIHQIDTVIQSSTAEGMRTMDDSILALWRAGRISPEMALRYAAKPQQLSRKLGL